MPEEEEAAGWEELPTENSRCVPTMLAECPSFMQMTSLHPHNSPGGQGGLQPSKGLVMGYERCEVKSPIPEGACWDQSALMEQGWVRAWKKSLEAWLGLALRSCDITRNAPPSHRNMTPMTAEGAWGPRNAI